MRAIIMSIFNQSNLEDVLMPTSKFKAGDIFPAIELSTVSGDKVTLGKPQHGADWQMNTYKN